MFALLFEVRLGNDAAITVVATTLIHNRIQFAQEEGEKKHNDLIVVV